MRVAVRSDGGWSNRADHDQLRRSSHVTRWDILEIYGTYEPGWYGIIQEGGTLQQNIDRIEIPSSKSAGIEWRPIEWPGMRKSWGGSTLGVPCVRPFFAVTSKMKLRQESKLALMKGCTDHRLTLPIEF